MSDSTYNRSTFRWQRRIATALLVIVLSLAVGLIWGPWARDSWSLWRLGSDDPTVWPYARESLVARAGNQGTLDRLNRALSTDDDRKFLRIADVLGRVGKWETPQRSRETLDRFWAAQINLSQYPVLRLNLLEGLLLTDRDNRYIRQSLAAGAADAEHLIRLRAALLAARLKDAATLKTLLADVHPLVRSAAAMDAGLAGLEDLTPALMTLLDDPDGGVSGSAAYALALLDPEVAAAKLPALLAAKDIPAQRERLLCILRTLPPEPATAGLEAVLKRCRETKTHPSAMALLLAARLKYLPAEAEVRAVLADATREGTTLTEAQLLAALAAADALELAVRGEARAICQSLWSPQFELTLTRAARVLGRQITVDQLGPSAAECILTLRLGVLYSAAHKTEDDTPDEVLATPVASAAAAVALWQLAPRSTYIIPPQDDDDLVLLKYDLKSSANYIHTAAGSPVSLAGDYAAWHMARSHRAEAIEAAMVMLPGPGAPDWARIYNDDIRSAGAMLLALSARTPEQRTAAVNRIEQHLRKERDFFVVGSYRCALQILGRNRLADVQSLYESELFPQRRSLTAMLVSGARAVLDDMLWGAGVTEQDVINLLVYRRVDEVLAATVPELPVPDIEADGELQLWQVQILRDAYVLRRADVLAGTGR